MTSGSGAGRNGMETGRQGTKGGGTSHSPSLSVDVEHVILLQIQLEEAARDLRNTGFELGVGDVPVVGQVEVLPGLGLLDLLSTDGLRDLLLLLDDVDDITNSVRLAFSVCAAGVEEDVVDGVDALRGAGDKSVLGLLQPAGAGLALGCGWTDVDGTLPPGFVGLEVVSIVGHVEE